MAILAVFVAHKPFCRCRLTVTMEYFMVCHKVVSLFFRSVIFCFISRHIQHMDSSEFTLMCETKALCR